MVVAFGDTTTLPLVATGFPLSKTCAALGVVHWSVVLPPFIMFVGLAVKELTVGHDATVTVTVLFAV